MDANLSQQSNQEPETWVLMSDVGSDTVSQASFEAPSVIFREPSRTSTPKSKPSLSEQVIAQREAKEARLFAIDSELRAARQAVHQAELALEAAKKRLEAAENAACDQSMIEDLCSDAALYSNRWSDDYEPRERKLSW